LRQVYYSAEDGFGSIQDTYKQANKILNTITLKDTKEWLERQKSRQTKAYKGFNSYVSSEPLQEIQLDLLTMSESSDGFKYIFVAIDIFTKICSAIPVKDKKPEESVRAMNKVLEDIGVPKVIYHDFEGSWQSKQFIRLINSHNIKQIITTTPAPFVERMNQTLRQMIELRLKGLELDDDKWIDILPSVVKKYNNTKHSTTGMTPIEAKKPSNQIQVYLNIKSKAIYKRTYPDLKINDNVRYIIKRHTFTKGHHSTWSRDVH